MWVGRHEKTCLGTVPITHVPIQKGEGQRDNGKGEKKKEVWITRYLEIWMTDTNAVDYTIRGFYTIV